MSATRRFQAADSFFAFDTTLCQKSGCPPCLPSKVGGLKGEGQRVSGLIFFSVLQLLPATTVP
jgi:hypothetical protein